MGFQGFPSQSLFGTMNKYSFIDWGKGETLKENVSLTEQEAHKLNYALALNGTTKRYVKESQEVEKHIYSNSIKHINIIKNS